MATIRDVAKLAGVSDATVSRVLNKKGYVSQETLKKVENAINELNYRPNEVARMLYKKRSFIIGLVLPDIKNPFFPELARAVEDVAERYGYTVILCNTDGDPRKEKKYIEILEQKYIDGLIISNNNHFPNEMFSFPVVSIDRIFDPLLPSVTAQNREGARIATEYLVSLGCKKIIHIRGPKHITTADERLIGYLEIMEKSGLPIHVEECDYDLNKSFDLAFSIFTNNPGIDAIFAGNDLIAAGVLKAAQQKGISIPEDLQIIGFDGIDVGRYTSPDITTISQPIYKMGETAANLLIDIIQAKKVDKTKYELPVSLEIRGTTKKA